MNLGIFLAHCLRWWLASSGMQSEKFSEWHQSLDDYGMDPTLIIRNSKKILLYCFVDNL